MTAIGHPSTAPGRVSLDRAIEISVAAGVVLLVVIGFVTSYETLRILAVSDGGFPPWLAPAVPLSFDLGIVVLSLKIVAAARRGHQSRALRILVGVLSVSSVAVNSTASTGVAGHVLHAVPPAMFVICFESAVAGARRGGRRPRSARASAAARWLLAPASTFGAWRQQLLAGENPAAAASRSVVRPGRRPTTTSTSITLPSTSPTRTAMSRLECAQVAVERMPAMTAPQLQAHLSSHGFQVSVRTAQRLKAALDTAPA